jgi:hypothetical protein
VAVIETAVTPSEYLAGKASGSSSRDGEIALLKSVIRELAAEKMQMQAAMRELLSGHDNLYRAHFGYLQTCDPKDDIATKAARTFLDGDG